MTGPAPAREASGRFDIFVIAGEESGDRLGAALMRALVERGPFPPRIEGIGGREMAAAGLTSLFPIDDLAIVGVSAIPRRLPAILRRIRQAAAAVIAARPDVLVIIDSPDFTHRVARKVRATLPDLPVVDYVSPSVWAWRPGRARAMRAYVDHVLALLPFEPAVHARLGGPRCTYVGHPLAEQVALLRPSAAEARRRASSPPLVLVLPGSRSGEIRRHLPVFGAAMARLAEQHGPLDVVLPTLPHLAPHISEATAAWPVRPRVVVDDAEKWAAFRSARAALAASGTVTLELALAGIPAVVAYKVSLIEEMIARALIKVPTIVLANLVLSEKIMPELLQRDATPQRLAAELALLLADTPQRRRQVEAFGRLDLVMEVGRAAPSVRAADIVLELARAHASPTS
jgi:lipid-A-disaccharide synthase